MGATSGTLQKVVLNGLEFQAMGDVDVTQILGQYTNEEIPTSGDSIRKMTRRTETRESVTIGCEPAEAEILKGYSEQKTDITLAYALADGSVYRATGWIDFENFTSADFKATLKLFPRNKWELFAK
jgi:hypothetical protein